MLFGVAATNNVGPTAADKGLELSPGPESRVPFLEDSCVPNPRNYYNASLPMYQCLLCS